MSAPWILALLLSATSPARAGDPPQRDLELASLAVTDRIRGGAVGPAARVQLAASYDRVERVFRVVRRRGDGTDAEVRIGDLTPDAFRELLDVAAASGLSDLPLESPPGCTDVYERNRQVRLDWGPLQWANGAPGGCVSAPSTVRPTDDDRRRFDDVVLSLERAVDALPLRAGGEDDLLRVPFLENRLALQTYRRVMEHVLSDPLRHGLDLERMRANEKRVSFCWRGRAAGYVGGDVDFVLGEGGGVVRVEPGGVRDVFDPFAPIETGASLAEVMSRLGTPDDRRDLPDGSTLVIYSHRSDGSPNGWRFLPCRLRFEDGRLAAP